jgi:hypothetical protein
MLKQPFNLQEKLYKFEVLKIQAKRPKPNGQYALYALCKI